jgi:nucleotide-binding universal stress UspA family protein
MPGARERDLFTGYGNILIPIDADDRVASRILLAANLANRFRSHLIGISARLVMTPLYFEFPSGDAGGIIELETKRAEEQLASAEALFRKLVGKRPAMEWRQGLADATQYIVRNSRAADIIIAERPRRDANTFTANTLDSGELVMNAGRPVLFVPQDVEALSAKSIIVGWKDTREARRAVLDAMPFLRAAEQVLVVSVESEDIGASDVVSYLSRNGVLASAQHKQKPTRDVADELVWTAKQEGADLIVCGAYGHSRTREWAFGGVTRDLLERSPICCLMAN